MTNLDANRATVASFVEEHKESDDAILRYIAAFANMGIAETEEEHEATYDALKEASPDGDGPDYAAHELMFEAAGMDSEGDIDDPTDEAATLARAATDHMMDVEIINQLIALADALDAIGEARSAEWLKSQE